MTRLTQVIDEPGARVRQGCIYSKVEFLERLVIEWPDIELERIVFPYVYVLTQDCDLESDSRIRWFAENPVNPNGCLLSVLVAPLYNADHVKSGTHLSELELRGRNDKLHIDPPPRWSQVQENNVARYHYLEFAPPCPVPPSVLDFKHYFAVSVETLHDRHQEAFQGRLEELERAHISQRFASFLSRIGLP